MGNYSCLSQLRDLWLDLSLLLSLNCIALLCTASKILDCTQLQIESLVFLVKTRDFTLQKANVNKELAELVTDCSFRFVKLIFKPPTRDSKSGEEEWPTWCYCC